MNTTNPAPETPWCLCGNCPTVRRERGLMAFCRMSTPVRRADGFGSYKAAAAARLPGQRVRSVGGLGTGSPKRFILV